MEPIKLYIKIHKAQFSPVLYFRWIVYVYMNSNITLSLFYVVILQVKKSKTTIKGTKRSSWLSSNVFSTLIGQAQTERRDLLVKRVLQLVHLFS